MNDVINTLCERFGVTATYLIEEMSRYYIAKNGVAVFLSLITFIVCCILCVKYAKKYNDDDFEDFYLVSSLFTGFLSIVGIIIFLCTIDKFVGLLVSPTGATVDIIIQNFK